MNRLHTQLGSMEWPTPVGLASGTCGWGKELDGLIHWPSVGAIFTKGLSLEPRTGHPPPRIWETPSGMLNAIGLENPGYERFVAEKLPFLKQWRAQYGGKVFVNLFATSVADYAELARRLDSLEGVDGVEVNVSCPNVKEGGIEFGRTEEGCKAVTQSVREATQKFVIVKLSPAGNVLASAQACEATGADALTLCNTMPAMAIDVHSRTPRISQKTGGLSGPAFRPIAVRLVYEISHAVKIPVIGVGGISQAEDALEFLLAGAKAIQIGTANFSNPNTAEHICKDLVQYLDRHGEMALSEIIGGLRIQ